MKIKTLARTTVALLTALGGLFCVPKGVLAQGPVEFIPIGSNYRYLDNGSDQGTAWRELSFNDAGWSNGVAPLGYGQANLNTTIGYGGNAANKYITAYFRHTFTTPQNSSVSNLLVRARRDDGCFVYLNGHEVFRSNMSTGSVNYLTLAASEVTGADESNYFSSFVFSTEWLAPAGSNNVLAAEVHLASPSSPDLVACLELTGNATLPTLLPISLTTGYSAIANNFNRGGNTLSELFPSVLDGTEIYKWNPGGQNYSRAIYDANSAGWFDTNASPANLVLGPGEAAWLYSPLAQSLSMTGQVMVVGYVNRPPGGGRRFVGARQPMASTFIEITGFAPITGDKVELYDGSFPTMPTQATSTHFFSNSVWNPALPLLPPAKGMFVDLVAVGCFDIQSPSNQVVSCGQPWSFSQPVVWDLCCNTNPVLVVVNSNLVSSTACTQIWERTWQISSTCSNVSTVWPQRLTVVDTTPPVFTNCPGNQTYACGTNWDFAPTPGVYEACCLTNPITTFTWTNLGCPSIYTRIWQAMDCCGNIGSCTQVVTVVDTTPPYFTYCPTNKSVPCNTNWTFDTPVAFDSCCLTNVSIFVVDTVISSVTPLVVTRTWRASDCCGNLSGSCSQTVTATNCPLDCIEIHCPTNPIIRYACGSNCVPVYFSVSASNKCNANDIQWTTDWLPNHCFPIGTNLVTATAWGNGQTQECNFLVVVASNCPPALTLGATLSAGQWHLGWGPILGEFGVQVIQNLGGSNSGWIPVSGLPIAKSLKLNQSGNTVEQFVSADIPFTPGVSPPNNFLRLSTHPGVGQIFTGLPTGNFSNAPAPFPLEFRKMGGGAAQIVDINNTHALLVDGTGLEILTASNRSEWPYLLTGAPNFHELNVAVMFASSNAQPMELKAFDATGQFVTSTQVSNTLFANVTFSSKGYPFGRFEFKMPGGGTGGIPRLDIIPDISVPFAPNCTDLRAYPRGPVPNPWVQPGFTITSSNSLGQLETNTYIEAGPEGNGYHVEYSARIKFANNTCCRKTEIQLARASASVDVKVTAYDASGTVILWEKTLSADDGNPAAVPIPPTTQPICSIVVRAPNGQTRILSVCCLPTTN